MTTVEKKDDDEKFEIIDLIDKNFFQRIVADLSKAGATKQLIVGGATGWGAGYLSANVGRTAAFSMGLGLLVIQLAHYKGLININWGKLEMDAKTKIRKLEDKTGGTSLTGIAKQVTDFLATNTVLAGGFAGGFLMGLGS